MAFSTNWPLKVPINIGYVTQWIKEWEAFLLVVTVFDWLINSLTCLLDNQNDWYQVRLPLICLGTETSKRIKPRMEKLEMDASCGFGVWLIAYGTSKAQSALEVHTCIYIWNAESPTCMGEVLDLGTSLHCWYNICISSIYTISCYLIFDSWATPIMPPEGI